MSTKDTNILTPGRFVIVTQGRHAGKKALVLHSYAAGENERKFPHILVVGIERPPKKVNKNLPHLTIFKRTVPKPFIKILNTSHVVVTRHVVRDDDIISKIDPSSVSESLSAPDTRKAKRAEIQNILHQKYLNQRFPWFFKKLHF